MIKIEYRSFNIDFNNIHLPSDFLAIPNIGEKIRAINDLEKVVVVWDMIHSIDEGVQTIELYVR